MRILVTEDHPDLQLELIDYLRMHGLIADGADSLFSMNEKLTGGQYQVVLLDLGLPDGDALECLTSLRQQFGLQLGIVIVSARGQPIERTQALNSGADAYLVKPVFLPELLAVLMQLAQRLEPKIHLTWYLDIIRRTLRSPGGEIIALSHSETSLLSALVEHKGVLNKEQLQCTLTPFLKLSHDYTRLDTLVCRLRQKVKMATGEALPLMTIRNKGYQCIDIMLVDSLRTQHLGLIS
ncbi:response regulator transcription factor [Alishewanella sp. BS5-314]|uniref:response regulator transcription factor n=1 Tax=Alishewanella sp. BS5-314 TaxID=2755587 RepID=UPI0021BB0E11|nr:response regulator transcription factor [Alishewanella sp. BS5-314]MCT8124581.1 response regulator transcription factor [Alishewanella sp. BS5-314]